MGLLGGEKSLPSPQLASRCLVYLPPTNMGQSRGRISYRKKTHDLCIFDTYDFISVRIGVGDTKIPSKSENTPTDPFKCLV